MSLAFTPAIIFLSVCFLKLARHEVIIMTYLKGMFVFDLMSIIPFGIIVQYSDAEGLDNLTVMRLIRLLRLIKLLRMLRGSRLFER